MPLGPKNAEQAVFLEAANLNDLADRTGNPGPRMHR